MWVDLKQLDSYQGVTRVLPVGYNQGITNVLGLGLGLRFRAGVRVGIRVSVVASVKVEYNYTSRGVYFCITLSEFELE